MPKNTEIKKILVIGSGPIVIGQGAEFDYAGSQACQTLRSEGYEVVLINSNPATIMTDHKMADKVYIEPLTLDFITRIIYQEQPDAILGTLGGQTGLNLLVELAETNILEQENIQLLGSDIDAIKKAEDRELFKKLMQEIGQPVIESEIVHSLNEALSFVDKVGFPLIVRPAYTLGGSGGGIVNNQEQLVEVLAKGLSQSMVNQCLLERSIEGFKEIEYEVMRDNNDQAIVVCNMENVDPVGIHTGDSIVVAPVQTLTDVENQRLRTASLDIIKALKISGGCNVQLAQDPNSDKYYIIEVNPRVSRSSALASKATGYPIARIAALIAVGYTLDEIINPVTNNSYACFEPTLDYIVCKMPRFAFDKFTNAEKNLSTQMKATGEVMAISSNFEASLLKAIRSLEIGCNHLFLEELKNMTCEQLVQKVLLKDDQRIFAIAQLLRNDYSIEKIQNLCKIDNFFLNKINNIIKIERDLQKCELNLEQLKRAKKFGISDAYLSNLYNMSEESLYRLRKKNNIIPVFKTVDTCAAEFISETPYYYSTWQQENESKSEKIPKVIVLGSGPIRIGQGIEFDYVTVHCIQTLSQLGYQAIVINNNPSTLSTDFTMVDKLYFEPLNIEEVMTIIDFEQPDGVIVQFGGQSAINLASLLCERNIKILGTSANDINRAEDRHEFERTLNELQIAKPSGIATTDLEKAKNIAKEIGYPVLVRPSFVLGGRAMQIAISEQELETYMLYALEQVDNQAPILIDKYINGREVEIDAICDGNQVFIPGIMEHVERAGIHSGDSISVYPTQTLSKQVQEKIVTYSQLIGRAFKIIGLFNIQFIVDDQENVFVLEVNPRSSRSMPVLSKITKINMAEIATKVIMNQSLKSMGITQAILPIVNEKVYVKAPVFSFAKLTSVDTVLGPEMKSTGEVLASDFSFKKALYKALLAANLEIKMRGSVLITVADQDKENVVAMARRLKNLGYQIFATQNTAVTLKNAGMNVKVVNKISDESESIINSIEQGSIDLIINTISQSQNAMSDGFKIRRCAAENHIACITAIDTANAIVDMIEEHVTSITNMGE